MLFLILLGMLTGFFSGLLGIGGGVITVPALYYLFLWQGTPYSSPMHIAVATSLSAILITTSISTWIHFRKGQKVLLPILGFLIPGLIVGCISGAELAALLPTNLLRMIFGTIAALVGIYFAIPHLTIPKMGQKPNGLLTFFGFLIGHLSSLLGIGGGIFVVPLLLSYQVPIAGTVATSSVSTFTTSLIGTITYLILATKLPSAPDFLGYIDLPAFFYISLGSLCTTALGVRLARTLPAPLIKRIFGIVLTCTGLLMIFL